MPHVKTSTKLSDDGYQNSFNDADNGIESGALDSAVPEEIPLQYLEQ